MNKNLFQRKGYVILFALMAMASWGCAYPFIKLGMKEFQILNTDFGGKILFAGIRFFCAGILTLVISYFMKQSIIIKSAKEWSWLFVFGLVNTGLHYLFFYIGLSNCTGSKASIIDSLGTFWLIILACIIFKENINFKKVVGCLLGFLGIIIANVGIDIGSGFSLAGEGMMILNTICAAFGGIITRIITRKINAIVATGYSLSIGGLILTISGIACGGEITHITLKGLFLLCGLIAISVVGFVLYNQLLCYNPVSEIAIFNVLIPVFGTIFSCIMLKEKFSYRYLAAIAIIATAIYIINFQDKSK